MYVCVWRIIHILFLYWIAYTYLCRSEIKLHERFQPAKLKSKNVKLMSDPLGGLVFYNGTMNQYSSNGIFFQRNLVPKPPSRTSSPIHKSANKDRSRTDDVLSYFSGAVTTYLPDSTVNTSPSHWSGFLYKDSEKDGKIPYLATCLPTYIIHTYILFFHRLCGDNDAS